MLSDLLIIKPHHIPPAKKIVDIILSELEDGPKRYIISIGGEAGTGKSTMAMAIKHILNDNDIKSFIFHMEDYYHLPPTSKYIERQKNISLVGPGEVNLCLLEKHICQVKKGLLELQKPFSHHKENEIRKEIVELDTQKVIIVEGIYASILKHVDKRVFMNRKSHGNHIFVNGLDSDSMSQLDQEVIRIEHEEVVNHQKFCDLVLNESFDLHFNTNKMEVEEYQCMGSDSE